MYEPRNYRNKMGKDKFISFTVTYQETDLWIAIDKSSYLADIPKFVADTLVTLRQDLDTYIKIDPYFKSSLSSVYSYSIKDTPEIAKEMIKISIETGIGPMGAVAGAFSYYIGKAIEKAFNIKEIIIENGGDLYLNVLEDTIVKLHAGDSSFANKICLKIKAQNSSFGVCTSSGTFGHSLNFGSADAVMIVCKNPILADSLATSLSNEIKSINDIKNVQNKIKQNQSILASAIIIKDNLVVSGNLEINNY